MSSFHITDHTVSLALQKCKNSYEWLSNDTNRYSITVLGTTSQQFFSRTLVNKSSTIRQLHSASQTTQTLELSGESHIRPTLQCCVDCHLWLSLSSCHSPPPPPPLLAAGNPTTEHGTLEAHSLCQ